LSRCATRLLSCGLLLLCLACNPGVKVEHRGDYAFLPGAPIVDTVAHDFDQLLVVERDARERRDVLTLLSGQLGAAGIGIVDLRRIAARHGGFQMAFERPLTALGVEAPEDDAETSPPLARLDDAALLLWLLDNDSLYDAGAQRWVRSVDSGDYAVQAHAAIRDDANAWVQLQLERGERSIDAGAIASPLQLDAQLDDEILTIASGEHEDVAYLVVELFQLVEPIADGDSNAGIADAGLGEQDGGAAGEGGPSHIEAMVRTTLAPGEVYRASPALLEDAFGKGCWTRQRPLYARVIQIQRRVFERGQLLDGVILRHHETIEIPPELWMPAIEEPSYPQYCERYR